MSTDQFRRVLLFSILATSTVVGCVKLIAHDPEKAAKTAIEFARLVLVNQDFDSGYVLISERASNEISARRLRSFVGNLHPDSYPTMLTISEYEPIPDAEAMLVYANSVGDSISFHYRIIMEGTAIQGYKVGGIFRDTIPPTHSGMKDKIGHIYTTN